MQTGFYGLNEKQAMETALELIGFKRAPNNPELWSIDDIAAGGTSMVGTFTIYGDDLRTFDQAVRRFGGLCFRARAGGNLSYARKAFEISQALMELNAQWEEQQAASTASGM